MNIRVAIYCYCKLLNDGDPSIASGLLKNGKFYEAFEEVHVVTGCNDV